MGADLKASKFNEMMKNPYCILKLGDYIVNTEIDEQGKLNPKWKF